MEKLYRIGLDIGVASVGWSILENDPITEEPVKILKMGVRTFSANEVEKTGESTAKARREKRGLHRRNRRRGFRMERLKNLFSYTFGKNVLQELKNIKNFDVYELRYRALDEKLSDSELLKIVLNISKRRGFKSNRKDVQSKEEGALLKAINQNSEFIKEKGYRTIGEAFYKDNRFKQISCGKQIYNIRNHSGDYRNCFLREDLKNELILILNSQKNLGNNKINEQFIQKIVNIFEKQRNFDEGPGQPSPYSAKFEVGKCTFLENESRAPKASYTFELFTALSKINSLKINDEVLTLEQKNVLYDSIKTKKELKFEQVRKLLGVPKDKVFNLCRYISKNNDELSEEEILNKSEKSVFVSMKNSYDICSKLGFDNSYENEDIINEVALMLSTNKSDIRIDEFINNSVLLKDLSQTQINNIKILNYDKFGSLSIKAMKQIIPHLYNGERYDLACKSAGFNHSSFEHQKYKYIKGDFVDERLKGVTSNVVKRSINQTLRVLNEIIKEYGSPQYINVELARDIAKDVTERRKIEKIKN